MASVDDEKVASPPDTPDHEKLQTKEPFKESTSDAKTTDDTSVDVSDDKEQQDGSNAAPQAGFGNYWRIFTYSERLDVFLYVVSVICAIGSGAAMPLMTIIFGQFTTKFTSFDSSTDSNSDAFRSDINTYVLYFIYLFVGRFVVTYVATEAASVAGIRVTRTIRKRFLESVLRQEIANFDDSSKNGSVASQVTTNGNRINLGVAEKLVITIQALSMFFSAFIVALVIQWKLALITMSIIPGIILCGFVCVTIDTKQETQIVKLLSQAGVLAQEALSSIKTVHAFWAHDKMIQGYDEYLLDARKMGNKKGPNIGLANSIYFFCMFSGTALAFWEGFRLYASGEIADVGTVLTVILSVTIGATCITMLVPQIGAITNAAAAATELFAIIDRKSSLDSLSSEGESPATCEGTLEIRDLSFAYPSRPSVNVLNNISLSLPAGKTTALVGSSGCGKSTIVGLLERWYQPNSGSIILDGRSIADYNLRWLRSTVRLVQQEPVLFRGTVFENVAKGLVGPQRLLEREKQMELVRDACKQSNAHDFVEALPQGYNTYVGERASMLSGGQKQRLAIARSIISNPKILLLDEATSALDPRAEGIVQDALSKAAVDKTTLVIAHKLSTIRDADNIIVMAHGEVVEQGTHNELLAANGQYATLVKAQFLGEEEKESNNDEVKKHSEEHEQEVALLDPTTLSAEKSAAPDVADIPVTGNYSLFYVFRVMLSEQKDMTLWLLLLFVASVIGGGTYPAEAILFSRLINVFALPSSIASSQADFYALMFFVFALANMASYGAIGWAAHIVAQTVTYRYRREMFHHFLFLDQDFFDKPENSSGALTSRLSSVPNAIQELIAQNICLVLVCIVNVIASTILSIATGWKLGLVLAFTGMPVLIGSGWARVKIELKFERDADRRFAESAALATEAVTSIRTVASLTLEDQICNEYNESLDTIAQKAFFTVALTSLAYALSQSLEFLLMALGFWYGSRLIANGEYTTTQFYVVYLSIMFGGQSAGQLFGYITSLTKFQMAANYVLWLRTLIPNIREDDTNAGVGPTGDAPLTVEDVHFRYLQRETTKVLNGINLDIPTGSYIACVGPSGCGKSTLMALLERFYDPTLGRILFGEQDITDMSPRLYRNHISLVQQEPTLYEGSVRDNIALGLQHKPSDDDILEACRKANAFDFISSLPEGLNTSCGSKGLQFSGGQRQRIAIARALIREPHLLLLDEATSALDTESERIVQHALDQAANSRTTVAVAHRLSTIRHADTIYVFADGKIAEQGTHEELQRLKGRYYEMCLAQALGNP